MVARLPMQGHRLAETDRHRGLALAEGRRTDRRDDDVAGAGFVGELLDGVELDLRDVLAVVLEEVATDPHLRRDLFDRLQLGLAGDFQGTLHRVPAPSAVRSAAISPGSVGSRPSPRKGGARSGGALGSIRILAVDVLVSPKRAGRSGHDGRYSPGMRISARNQLRGTVLSVEQGAVMAEVRIRLVGGEEVVAAVTKESVESLAIAVGDEVLAVIKSTSVMVAKR